MTRRDRKRAEKKRKKIAELCEAHPHVKEALKIREKCGRPRLEADQPELLKAIVDIAIHDIQKDGLGRIDAVEYSGPTYVAIRSGKQTTSTAYSHGLDFERLLELPEFDKITKFDNAVKLVVVFVVDGVPDENPRYHKTIQVGVHHFRQNNLDALFIAANIVVMLL
ncbi:hypothetical protein AVEN_212014-1 [Araneus ventricosus]|uniref:Uncharacterized protein n=1 Tax=Araneus ventricosus TaxID=182803 RepID=A0A4Y2WTC1_ARAVE|nr:hypothetical protein AVEN_212014-1 [Araneus ventricosus]